MPDGLIQLEEKETLTPYTTFPQISHVSNYTCITQLTPNTKTCSALIRYTTVLIYKTAFENKHVTFLLHTHITL